MDSSNGTPSASYADFPLIPEGPEGPSFVMRHAVKTVCSDRDEAWTNEVSNALALALYEDHARFQGKSPEWVLAFRCNRIISTLADGFMRTGMSEQRARNAARQEIKRAFHAASS